MASQQQQQHQQQQQSQPPLADDNVCNTPPPTTNGTGPAAAQQEKQQPSQLYTDTPADLSADLTSPASPTTAHAAADARRAMSATAAWKPMLDRRQSWDDQEYKRELQMSGIGDVKTGPGFSERK